MSQCPIVGIGSLGLIIAVISRHPVVVVAVRMAHLDTLIIPCSHSHTAHLHALELAGFREVNVQAHSLRQSLVEHLAYYLSHIGAQRREVGIIAMVAERESNRRDILHAALKRNAHRSTIMYVDRPVVAVIDSAYHHVGTTVGKEFLQGYLHTVNRRAIARPHLKTLFLATKLKTQRHCGREGCGKTRACRFRGTHYDIRHVTQHIDETVYAFGMIAVVVRNKY